MQVLSLNGMTKSFGIKDIIVNATFAVHHGEKTGLIGANGSGKSTLMKLMASVLQPSQGQLTRTSNLDVGYLPQTMLFSGKHTVGSWLQEAQQDLHAMELRMEHLTAQMAARSEPEQVNQIITEYGEVAERFEQRGGYDLSHRLQAVLQGLELSYLNEAQPIAELSGGEKTRLGLAAILIQHPDVLLLDEPTNHLDFAAMDWLESYFQAFQGTLVVISHDRTFLNKTVTKILEVDEFDHKVREYTGNYDAYMQEKQRKRKQWEEQFAAEQLKIQELKKRIHETAQQVGHNRPPKDGNKMAYFGHGQKVQRVVSSRVRAAELELERILENPTPRPPEPMQFAASLEAAKIHRPVAVTATHVSVRKSDGTAILKDVSFTLGKRDHVLITGVNGAGKTTLLNLIANVCSGDAVHHFSGLKVTGDIFIPRHIKPGYIQQEFHQAVSRRYDERPLANTSVSAESSDLSLLDTFRQLLPGQREEHIAKLLSYQLFKYEEFNLRVSDLSPGQHRKLMLAKLMAEKANLLLVDEPTNHISFDILAEFERALNEFPGPIIAVSHDRWFIEHFQGSVWTLEDGMMTSKADAMMTKEDERKMVAEIQALSQYKTD